MEIAAVLALVAILTGAAIWYGRAGASSRRRASRSSGDGSVTASDGAGSKDNGDCGSDGDGGD